MGQAGTGDFLPAYLAVGEDEMKRRRVAERLRGRVAALGDLEFNRDEFDGERASGEAIVDACNTLPFASELRLVEVTSADKLVKADVDPLVAYLKAPNPTTVLALSAPKLAKNTRLYKAVAALGAKAVIDCAPMKRYELVRSLRSRAVDHGFTMTEGACERLVELVGEDTVALESELKKLALACAGTAVVGEREVSALVTRTAEAKPWELVNAFSARDARACAALLPLLDSASPYALIGMFTGRLRELARGARAGGQARRRAESPLVAREEPPRVGGALHGPRAEARLFHRARLRARHEERRRPRCSLARVALRHHGAITRCRKAPMDGAFLP